MLLKKFGREFLTKFWTNEQLNPELIAIDTETTLIESPAKLPHLILTTVYDGSDFVYVIKNKDIAAFMELNKSATFNMWNAAFDVPVLEKNGADFTSHINDSKLLDGQVLFRLLNIASLGMETKRWSLDYVSEILHKEILEKNDDIRLAFGKYRNQDSGEIYYNDISSEHIKYACLDPIATYFNTKKILAQIKLLPTTTNLAHDINLVGDLALAQVTRNGISIDQTNVVQIRQNLNLEKVKNEEILATYGYVKGKKGNTKVVEEICKREGFSLPVTQTGKLCVAKNFLEEYKSHPFISAYLKFKGFSKQQNFLNDLNAPIVHPRYNSIKVTARTSCTRPNIQNMPRIGGIRECFIPEPGHVFIDCDYSTIELCALSAICLRLFKYSIMADKINLQQDLHRYLASKIYNCSEEEVTKEQRQFAKIGNFGFGADMGIDTFIKHAAKSGYVLSIEEASKVKEAYLNAYPEMKQYFKRARGRDTLVTDTGFIRTGCSYTEYLNCGFQTKTAEGAKIMLYNLIKSGYKVVAFVHDQVLVSHPTEDAERALEDVKRIMVESMSKVIIGVRVAVDGKIKSKFEK